jgi:hypothetical protein
MAAPKKVKYKDNSSQTGEKGSRKKITYCLGSFIVGVGATVLSLSIINQFHEGKLQKFFHNKRGISTIAPSHFPVAASSSEIRSLEQLLTLDPKELEKIDIGLMNLLCAQGLKGTENLDINNYLATLEEWTKVIKHETEIRFWQFQKDPGYYDNSKALFRMVMLVLGLKEKLGVHYNLENMKTPDYSDSSQIFIHGLLGPKREGSCVSLPVLCTAVGRRLGYPINLVHTAGHSFVRWDDAKTGEIFNVEPSMNGTDTFPDEHYKKWPTPLTDLQLKSGYYLKSLTAAEELSSFLTYRGNSLQDTGRITEAQIAFAYAYHFSPGWANNLMPLAAVTDGEMRKLWEKDCELMGNKKVRYTQFSGFRIDPREAQWVYPPYPAKDILEELAKKTGKTPQDLLYAELFRTMEPAGQQSVTHITESPLQYGSGYRYAPRFVQQQKNPGNTEQQQSSQKPASNISSEITNQLFKSNQK